MNYIAIIHHDPGSAYGVSFPDVPDCFAASDEAGDILKHAIAALDDYFSDGKLHPEPSAIEEIRADVADDLAEGAYLIAVPFIDRKTKSERINVSFDRGLLRAIDEAANTAGLNRSAYLALSAKNEITGQH